MNSTYQGKPPNNAKMFYSWLERMVERLDNGEALGDYLKNVHYLTFGCGNSSWASTYQRVSTFVDKALARLGAVEICPITLYNEAEDDMEETFGQFFKQMAPKLMHSLPEIGSSRLREVDAKFAGGPMLGDQPLASTHHANSAIEMVHLGNADNGVLYEFVPSCSFQTKQIFRCRIEEIRDITPDALKHTVHLELKTQGGMKYRAGDHLVVCPEMPKELVDRVLSLYIDYDGNDILQWERRFETKTHQFQLPLDTPMTIRNILTNLVDLKAIPTKQFIANLIPILQSNKQAAELQNSLRNVKEFKEWIDKHPKPFSNADLIELYPIQDDKLGRLLEILPPIKPRPYSISSSSRADPSRVHITVGVVEDEFPSGSGNGQVSVYHGAASYYLYSLIDEFQHQEQFVNVYVEPADESFDLPKNDNTPIILVSAGTGFAPMRGFIHERRARNAKGPIYVFFGCRNEGQDVLYESEMRKFQQEGLVTEWFVAFSRSNQFPCGYIQTVLLQEADLVWEALQQGAHVYVCGSGSRVGVGVRDSLLQIVANKGTKSPEEAEKYLESLESSGRYEQDVWG